MNTKLFEVRDAGTFIPVIATRMVSDDEKEAYLLNRGGYSRSIPLVLLTRIGREDRGCHFASFEWRDLTMQTAHDYISAHFDELESGAVIDVEFIRGLRAKPKVSEREG
jgi:hypothetical protein